MSARFAWAHHDRMSRVVVSRGRVVAWSRGRWAQWAPRRGAAACGHGLVGLPLVSRHAMDHEVALVTIGDHLRYGIVLGHAGVSAPLS